MGGLFSHIFLDPPKPHHDEELGICTPTPPMELDFEEEAIKNKDEEIEALIEYITDELMESKMGIIDSYEDYQTIEYDFKYSQVGLHQLSIIALKQNETIFCNAETKLLVVGRSHIGSKYNQKKFVWNYDTSYDEGIDISMSEFEKLFLEKYNSIPGYEDWGKFFDLDPEHTKSIKLFDFYKTF
jgi:hypothetical protein